MKNLITVLVSFICINLIAQDTLKKKNTFFHITVGASEFIPFKESYKEIMGTKPGNFYSNFDVTNRITFGYITSVGFGVSLNKKVALITDFSYFFFREKVTSVGESYGDFPPYCFSGELIQNRKYHTLGRSLSMSIKFDRILFDNGIGFSYLVKSYQSNSSHNILNDTYSAYNESKTSNNKFTAYSINKLGIEVIKNRVNFYLGAILNYNQTFIKGIHPNTSLQIKI